MSDHKTLGTGFEYHDQLINKLTEMCATFEHRDLIRALLTNVVQLGLDKADNVDLKLLNNTITELSEGFMVFSPYRSIRKVTIFGSARSSANSPEYKFAQEFSKKIVEAGLMIITGAGPGVMEAGNKGATREHSFGVNIELPFEQAANQYIENDPKLMILKYFFTRKLMFIRESHATVVFPGGFGTLNEAIENITLFQTGKCAPRPIILIEPHGFGFWKPWFSSIKKTLIKNSYISDEDLKLFTYSTSIDEAVNEILNFYKVFHSIRRIKGFTVFRLNYEISNKKLEYIRKEFPDVYHEKIEQREALPEEIQKGEFPELPRLVFILKEVKYGRLCEMIRFINS